MKTVKTTIDAQVAGYEYALRNTGSLEDYDIDMAIVLWWGSNDFPQEIEDAFYRGIRHSTRSDFITAAKAAAIKSVDPNTVYRILQDDTRREKIFPNAVDNGETGTARKWFLHIEDVMNWTPDTRGRKRKNGLDL